MAFDSNDAADSAGATRRARAEGAAQSQEVLGYETYGQGTGHGVQQFYDSCLFFFFVDAEEFFSVMVVDQRISQDNEPKASPYCRLLKRQTLTCSSRTRSRKHPVVATADCRPLYVTHNAGGDRRDGRETSNEHRAWFRLVWGFCTRKTQVLYR